MKTSPHIFKTQPHFVPKVWGGHRLQELFSKQPGSDEPIGESWEVADLKEGQSKVASGPLAGLPVQALSRGWRRAMVGRKARFDDRFPLLVKLLDAQKDLSVQVHPGPDTAPSIEGAQSKRETWLILDAAEDAQIIHGLAEKVSKQDFRRAVDQGTVEELLYRQRVQKGDVIHIDPGTIHAICSGVALLEIQEPSDTTYRVYDYDRPGLDGNPRQLHIDNALAVGRLEPSTQIIDGHDKSGKLSVIGDNEAYRIERVRFDTTGPAVWGVDPDSPQVLHLLEGAMTIEDGIGGQFELSAHETAVVPAISGRVQVDVREASSLVAASLPVPQIVRGLRRGWPAAATS